MYKNIRLITAVSKSNYISDAKNLARFKKLYTSIFNTGTFSTKLANLLMKINTRKFCYKLNIQNIYRKII